MGPRGGRHSRLLLVSYMTALDQGEAAHAIAISNYIQTVRSTKTAKGFGSNYGAGGSKSVDRWACHTLSRRSTD
eukprot:COSAG01_NODE_1966_length_8778_cov_41.983176_4_plen_74_part_00